MNVAPLSAFALSFALALPAAAAAPTPEEAEGIRRAALDYAESWYAGDPAQMEKALHPDLAKRIVRPGRDGARARLEHMGALQLVQGVRAGYGKNTPADQQLKDVTILDVTGNAATVKLVMAGWVDYLHVARLDGQWKIVNVLWELTTPR
jgi:hypothetical protein